MSLLGQLAVGWHPERAATIALAHILDVQESPGMAAAFVDFVGQTGSLQFTPARVEADPDQKDDRLPDVTLHDARQPRVFVETVFWEGVPQAQPLDYLAKLPGNPPSALVYIAPRKRLRFLWAVLRERCDGSSGTRVADETQRDQAIWARLGAHTILVASWTYLLDELRRVADDPGVGQDVAQLRGLVRQMETAAFLPIDEDELADRAMARRLLDYRKLAAEIARRLEKEGLAGNVKSSSASYRGERDHGHEMLVHDRFQMRFGIELGAWRDSGITPLWWVWKDSKPCSNVGYWLRVKRHFDGARSYNDSLYLPVRLRTGVGEEAVIADAVERMRDIAARLRDVCQAKPLPDRGPITHRLLLRKVVRGIRRPPEPAATLALFSLLNASPEITRQFIDLLEGERFDVGRIGSEWTYARGVKPDLSIHDTGSNLRILVENKFDATLQPSQPVRYLDELPSHLASTLAFIAPERRLDSLWNELKAECVAEGRDVADESPPGDPRRMRVGNHTMLITSWKRVLDALQKTAAASGQATIEQDIAQLRGLAEGPEG